MPRYEAVCDCCLETQHLWSDQLQERDCPLCGVGKLLGPWPATPRFESSSDWGDVVFPHFKEEAPKERE